MPWADQEYGGCTLPLQRPRDRGEEALGALGDAGSIDIMRAMSDDLDEPTWCGRLVILLLIGSNGKPRIRGRLRN